MTGLFFGSFNPIHNGHMAIAEYLLNEGYCNKVWFIVSPRNPFKTDKELLPESKRMEMVSLALSGNDRLRACDIEFGLPKPSYTADTLRKLSESYPEEQFALIMGADNLRNFHLWKDYDEILSCFPVFVYPRPQADVTNIHYNGVTLVDAPLSDISSTDIRQKVREGVDITADVPAKIVSFVVENYRCG